MLAEMKDVISLTIGEPDFTTPEPITRAAIASLEAGETHYTANGGMIELRELIAPNLRDRYGVAYDPRRSSSSRSARPRALTRRLRATINAGDEVIYHEPCFVAYAPCIELAGGTAVAVSTTDATDFRVTADMIEAAITPRTKAIFLGYPNNPTGAVLDRAELEAIARVADEHDLLVYSDEIYDRLVYGDHRAHRLQRAAGHARPDRAARRLQQELCDDRLAHRLRGRPGRADGRDRQGPPVRDHVRADVGAVRRHRGAAQRRAARAGAMRAEYDRRRRYMTDRFNQIGLHLLRADGRLLLLPARDRCDRASTRRRSPRSCSRRSGSASCPGRRSGPSGAGHVRVCYATAYEEIVEAMDRIERFVARHRA